MPPVDVNGNVIPIVEENNNPAPQAEETNNETTQGESDTTPKEEGVSETKSVPYTRFKDVNDKFKDVNQKYQDSLDYIKQLEGAKNADAITKQVDNAKEKVNTAADRKFKDKYDTADALYEDFEKIFVQNLTTNPEYADKIFDLIVNKGKQNAQKQDQEIQVYQSKLAEIQRDMNDPVGFKGLLDFAEDRYAKGYTGDMDGLYDIYKSYLYKPGVQDSSKVNKGGNTPNNDAKQIDDKTIRKLGFDDIVRVTSKK